MTPAFSSGNLGRRWGRKKAIKQQTTTPAATRRRKGDFNADSVNQTLTIWVRPQGCYHTHERRESRGATRVLGEIDVKRFACGARALCLMPACLILACFAASAPVRAQNQAADDLKGKIFDARMAKQTFAGALKFCNELDGKHFYFQARDRVLDLEEFHRSLENLAKQQVFNPEKHRPWTEQDAAERWDQVQKQAASDQANCQLVASLPALEKQLDDLEKNPPAPEKKN
jgi:hypothetical protein